jgi:hypothetical protein
MQKVAAVAAYLGEKLVLAGEKVDLTVLRQAALLHDIVKVCDFKSTDLIESIGDFNVEDKAFWMKLHKTCHADGHITTVCNILTDLGEPVLADIINKHRYTSIIEPDPSERPGSWEEKLLYYADKRVMHDKIVTVKERLEDGRRRYFGNEIRPEDVKVEKALLRLEKEICGAAHINPEDILS